MKVSDLAEALVRDYTINRRKSLRTVRYRWACHLKPFFEAIPAETISTDQVETYISLRLEQKAENSTINRELAALKRMYVLAIRSRRLSLAECPYIPHLKETNVRKGFLRDSEYRRLAEETGKIGLWLRAMFECGVTFGCRKSELLNLRVRQVNLEERSITLEAGETKNEEARLLPLRGQVLELVAQCIAGKAPNDYVFTRPGVHSMDTPIIDMRDAWAKATQAAGCPALLFHDLRRTGVRNLIRSGVPEKVAMRISGHLTRDVFDRYHIVSRTDLDDAMEKLEAFNRKQRQLDLFRREAELPFETKKPN